MGVDTIQSDQRYRTLVTDIGKAKIALATLTGEKVNIVEAAVGDGGGAYYSPTAAQTALVREVWRGEIANKRINPESSNMMDIKVLLPSDVGGWTIREVGLFDDDGDMICITNTPDTEKALITTGATASLDIIMHILFTDIESVTVKVNPAIDQVTAKDVEIIVGDAIAVAKKEIISEGAAITQLDITIPVSAWTEREFDEGHNGEDEPGAEWRFEAAIACDGVLGTQVPVCTLKPASYQAALDAGLYPGATTADDSISFWSREPPIQDLELHIALLSSGGTGGGGGGGGGGEYILPTATSTRLGGVKIKDGGGLKIDATGNLELDAATAEDIEELYNSDSSESEEENSEG